DLSKRRAQSVVGYLISVGCDDASLIARGYGEGKPIASNETEEGRAQNRRVEFRFLKR
ncbi:MAG: OmpA family protein, partial [candidate division Zixibacteria bacterium]|nr:OmpA family protein [candidate division Zixibacteria bacterium]